MPHSFAAPSSTVRGDWPRVAGLLLVLPCAAWLLCLARFYRRFIFDDASGTVFGLSDNVYVTASFGRSVVSGAGFVWYDGAPKVERIANPLWAVLIGALHKLPFFSEQRLGLFVVGLNAIFLLAIVVLFARTARRALGVVGTRPRSSALLVSISAALLLPWCVSLSYWSAEGFEVALLCLFAYAALYLALRPRTAASCLALGVVLVLGLATRLEFALLASAVVSVALSHQRGSRLLLLWTALVSVALVGALVAWRHDYYGVWLPNGFFLRTTAARLQRGLHQNQALLLTAWVAFLPLLMPRVRHNLAGRLPCVAAGLCAFGLAVLYSCYRGGDTRNTFAGYDRHTAAAAVLLCWSLCLLIVAAARTWYTRTLCSLWSLLLLAAPVVAHNGVKQVQRGLVAKPGHAEDICRPGAVVYFSPRTNGAQGRNGAQLNFATCRRESPSMLEPDLRPRARR